MKNAQLNNIIPKSYTSILRTLHNYIEEKILLTNGWKSIIEWWSWEFFLTSKPQRLNLGILAVSITVKVFITLMNISVRINWYTSLVTLINSSVKVYWGVLVTLTNNSVKVDRQVLLTFINTVTMTNILKGIDSLCVKSIIDWM